MPSNKVFEYLRAVWACSTIKGWTLTKFSLHYIKIDCPYGL